MFTFYIITKNISMDKATLCFANFLQRDWDGYQTNENHDNPWLNKNTRVHSTLT